MNDLWTAFSAVVGALALVATAYAAGRRIGYKQARRELNQEREARRFSEIYAPVRRFLITCHITTVTGRGAPHLRQRVRNAWELLVERRLRASWRALFDRQEMGTLGEVEYGSPFPLQKINAHLKGREQWADATLINLLNLANRAQYEDQPREDELTAADLALLDHVCEQHDLLAHRFVG